MTRQPVSAVLGRWRITSMDLWDADYIDMLGPAHIQLDRDGGHIRLGVVQIGLDCWYSATGVRFTFHGHDEMTEVSGDGDADLSLMEALAVKFASIMVTKQRSPLAEGD